VNGRNAQQGDQGPADGVAYGDGRHTADDAQVGPPAKGTQVRPIHDGGAYEVIARQVFDKLFQGDFNGSH
jgi:hypothetical protein